MYPFIHVLYPLCLCLKIGIKRFGHWWIDCELLTWWKVARKAARAQRGGSKVATLRKQPAFIVWHRCSWNRHVFIRLVHIWLKEARGRDTGGRVRCQSARAAGLTGDQQSLISAAPEINVGMAVGDVSGTLLNTQMSCVSPRLSSRLCWAQRLQAVMMPPPLTQHTPQERS